MTELEYPGQETFEIEDPSKFELGSGNDPGDGSIKYFIIWYRGQDVATVWTWNLKWERDQAFAFCWDQYTNYKSGMNLEAIEETHGSKVKEAEIFRNWLVLILENEKEVPTPGTPVSFVAFHLLILDLVNSGRVKLIWGDPSLKPFPLNKKI